MTKMTNSTVKSKFSPLKQLNFSVLGEGFPIGLLWPLSRTETDHEIENRDHHMIFLLLVLFQYILMENYTRKNIKFSFFLHSKVPTVRCYDYVDFLVPYEMRFVWLKNTAFIFFIILNFMFSLLFLWRLFGDS